MSIYANYDDLTITDLLEQDDTTDPEWQQEAWSAVAAATGRWARRETRVARNGRMRFAD